jgi:predicted transcriptional regulator
MRHSQTPLTPREEDAFKRVREILDETDPTRHRDALTEALAARMFDEDESVYLVEQLLSKGYLYAVHEEVRITGEMEP